MKSRALAYWQRKEFDGYLSPWVPVSRGNIGKIEKGGLIIDETGFQKPHTVGRDFQHYVDGRLVETCSDRGLRHPVLAFVDTSNTKKLLSCLKGNPFSALYYSYSRKMEKALKTSFSIKIGLVADAQFPLFHETNLEGARNIKTNGVDFFTILSRPMREFGRALCTVSDQAERHGTLKGKMLEFSALPHEPTSPKWIDRRGSIEIFNATLDLSEFISRDPANLEAGNLMRTSWGLYLWSTVCAELSASALKEGNCVFIFDDFERFRPAKII